MRRVAINKSHLIFLAVLSLSVAACNNGESADGTVTKKEDPAEQGAAQIERKADEAVKAKLAEFEAQRKREEQTTAPVTANQEANGLSVGEKAGVQTENE